MSRLFYHVCQDNAGNLLFDVSGTMRLAGTGTLATIYGDEALTVILPNPMTNHPSFASFKCFLPSGDFDFYLSKSGYTFETLTGLQGHGTMAQQDASAVAITGGTAIGLSELAASSGDAYLSKLRVGSSTVPTVQGQLEVAGPATLNNTFNTNASLTVRHTKPGQNGLNVNALGSDTGGVSLGFFNVVGSYVGGITTTASATAYNTSSDARLKHDVATLTGELDLVRLLRPVSFVWNADGSPGVGFLAHEVAAHVAGVITGEPGEVDEAGGILPQMIDYSKLVPYLVGAIQSLAARVAVLEDALGV